MHVSASLIAVDRSSYPIILKDAENGWPEPAKYLLPPFVDAESQIHVYSLLSQVLRLGSETKGSAILVLSPIIPEFRTCNVALLGSCTSDSVNCAGVVDVMPLECILLCLPFRKYIEVLQAACGDSALRF